ncbi:hypothetical protein ANANG_G00008160 [Anguilla anguilla]|uniref:Stereocilin LRR domain-containing protein n=1 Tax=Anguilla anguilla TaxID=7936 RepID=A0A9D3MX51_ANGAN|nr:hypothetical protein ANANG_G00008160 [Anguilla anguilla]
MSALRVTVFTLFLTFHGLLALSPDMDLTMMPGFNDSVIRFPPLNPEFINASHALMAKCLKMGHRVPMMMYGAPNSSMGLDAMVPKPVAKLHQLLSSFAHHPMVPSHPSPSIMPNGTMEPPYDMDWNMTERLQNCSSMPHMIALIRNISDGPQCFMRAFMAPFSWMVLKDNGSEIDPSQFKMLLWVAKPFIQDMLPSELVLPAHLRPPQLAEMVNMFSEVYSSLTPKHHDKIHKWIMDQIRPNNFNCSKNPPKPTQRPDHTQGHGPGKSEDRPQIPLPAQGQDDNGPCQRKNWLNATEMEMMGQFVTLLPVAEFENTPKDELCAFFWKPRFQTSFRGVVPRPLGRMLLKMLKKCFTESSEFPQHLDRIGSLACFFDDPKALNSSESSVLLSRLRECDNPESVMLKKELLMKVSSQGNGPLSPDILQSVGSAASVLSMSLLNRFTPSAIRDNLPSMGKAQWNPAQAKVLADMLMKEATEVSGNELISLGSVVRGVSSSLLRKAKLTGLLGTEEMDTLSHRLSALQRAALLDGLRSEMNASQLVRSVSGPLLARLSLSTLEQANLTSVDQLEGKNWTKSQSALLVKKILKGRLRPSDIMKLQSAVQGVTCQMIDNTNQSDVKEVSQALTGSMHWLSRTQVGCVAKKLYNSLENERKDYFNNITNAELDAIPTPLLIYMPVKAIMALPRSVCAHFLDKMSQANLTTLPLSSSARSALTNRSLNCLGKNVSDLNAGDITRLGPLVCELQPAHLANLSADAQNATLQALAKCIQINRHHMHAIVTLLKAQYGPPSNWSSSTMTSFGSLLLLNDTEINSLTYKSGLKESLMDVLDRLPPDQSQSAPEEFRIRPSLSAVRKKLFYLITYPAQPSPAARRKRAACADAPTLSAIMELGEGNVEWTPAQLACISTDDFNSGVQILGGIVNYNPQQLEALKSKVIQVWGKPGSLSASQVMQLGCVAQGFSPEELKVLNITSLDTLELLESCNWTQQQREGMWCGYVNRTGHTVSTLGTVEMVGLGQFICGLSPEELRNLSTNAFREAVSDMGGVSCPVSKMELLKSKAVLLFGKPKDWTEAQVNNMGNIIAGLNETELQSLNGSVLSFIRQSAIPLIPPARLAALSVSQMQALGADNAAMVTTAQRAVLSEQQREALGSALGVPYTRSEATTQKTPAPVLPPKGNGVSRVGIVGAIVFLQQFLLLTLWYAV